MQYSACRSIAFVFVCQRGRLEIESVLLAASLKHWVRGGCELIAAIPKPTGRFGEPQEVTLRLLREMGVRMAHFENEFLRERPSCEGPYLLTNKIFCLRVPTKADKLVFLDSDQLCRREFLPAEHLRTPLSARKADFVSSRDVGDAWERIFHAAGAELPNLRIRIPMTHDAAGPGVYAPPSFNSSFLAIDANSAAEFSQLWAECFRRIDEAGVMGHVRYYQEQASLAVAAHKSGIAYEMLETRWINPCLAHYFRPGRIRENPKLVEVARSLAREQRGIQEILHDFPEWRFLVDVPEVSGSEDAVVGVESKGIS